MEKAIKQIAEEYIDKTPREILDELSEIFHKLKDRHVFREKHDYLMEYFCNQELIKILDNLEKNYLYSFTKFGKKVVSIHDQRRMQQQDS